MTFKKIFLVFSGVCVMPRPGGLTRDNRRMTLTGSQFSKTQARTCKTFDILTRLKYKIPTQPIQCAKT